jgi:hypothetical protein
MQAEATFMALGLKEPMYCMSYFPILIKTAHLKELRAFIMTHMKANTFNKAFFDFSAEGIAMYSQFNIMCAFLWYEKRDEYAWYMHDTSPWWDGLTDPAPRPEQIADKTLFEEHMFYPKPYVAGHLYARSIEPEKAGAVAAGIMANGLCWRYPNASIELLEGANAQNVTKRVLAYMGERGNHCLNRTLHEGYFRQNHMFEESSDFLMYDNPTLVAADQARRDSLAQCTHTYYLI